MNTYSPKRYSMKYEDDDQITDIVIGADNTEYVVTASGKAWRDYDWIVEHFEPSARRMADYTHFIYLNNQDECTHSMVFDHSAQNLKAGLEKGPNYDEPYDPKAGTQGSA